MNEHNARKEEKAPCKDCQNEKNLAGASAKNTKNGKLNLKR